MSLLNLRTELVLLISILGILLPTPAQALSCNACEGECETGKMVKTKCNRIEVYCSDAEYEFPDGWRRTRSGCTRRSFADNHGYSCDEFKPYHASPNLKVRLCTCQTSYCNGDLLNGYERTPAGSASIYDQIHHQLPFLCAFVSISASFLGQLMK